MPRRRPIEWSEQARADLLDVVDYLAAEDPKAASRFLTQLDKRLAQVARFPYSGRPVPEDLTDKEETSRREVILMRWRVGYLAGPGETISVLSVIHGARRFPPLR